MSEPLLDRGPPRICTFFGFSLHILLHTALFFVVAAAAVGLHFFIDWLKVLGVTVWIWGPLEVAKYFIFAVDLLMYVAVVSHEAYSRLRQLFA